MLRRIPVFAFVVVALLAIEPLLHQHPLQPDSNFDAAARSICAVCATGVGRLPVIAPAVAAPQVIVYVLAVAAVTLVTVAVALPVASRAPPAL